ncbi:MAG: dihydrolipoyl dehydrogenase [Candidatus Omnitrophota bacterium]|nr:dihydrolipoyl dehydrogenase [Candidatus Omnitrophota bacterium]
MKAFYDVIIIGAGPAGFSAAVRLARLKKKVCLVDLDKQHFGGTCLNLGCVPTKFLENTAEIFRSQKEAAVFGLEANFNAPDMKKIVSCSEKTVLKLRKAVEWMLNKHQIDFLEGKASFVSREKIIVTGSNGSSKDLKASFFIIAVGSRPKVPKGLEPDNQRVITSDEAVKLKEVPQSMVIVGGGAIGCEFASIYSSFGSKVTIVEARSRLIPGEDEEISRTLNRELKKQNIDIYTSTEIKRLDKKKNQVEVLIKTVNGEETLKAEYVLLSCGRIPNTNDLELEKIALNLNKRFIKVDEFYKTNLGNIYAVGDVIFSPMFAYTAQKEGVIAAEAISGKNPQSLDYTNVPRAIFCAPQVASVGLTESEARKAGEIKIDKQFFKANSLAVIKHKESGFVKIISGAKGKKILGVHIIGHQATEIIHEFVLAKCYGLTIDKIKKVLHVHPTISEIFQEQI